MLKDLELSWRRFCVRLLTRALRGIGSRARRGERPRLGRVLFLRPDRIGDMIVTTGVLRAIATSGPVEELAVLASPANAPVALGEPFIGRVHVLDRRRPLRALRSLVMLRRAAYDAVVDCMPTAPSVTTLLLMMASGAPERIGVAGRGNDGALTIAVPPRADARHIVDHLSALATAFGVSATSTDFSPLLTIDPDERARAIGAWQAHAPRRARPPRRLLVNISAGKPARHWPNDRFIEIIRRAASEHPDLTVLLVSGPSDVQRAGEIAAAGNAAVAATKTLRDALALVATADLVLSADTGLAHAAAALRRPVVTLHLNGTSALWGLYGATGAAIESIDRTLASLPVEPVWRAVDVLLRPLLRQPPNEAAASATVTLTNLGPLERQGPLNATPANAGVISTGARIRAIRVAGTVGSPGAGGQEG